MTTLSPTSRKAIQEIFEGDFEAIQEALTKQIKIIWAKARELIEKERGLDKLYEERATLNDKREKINQRLHEIELKLNSEPLTKQQVIELGGKKDQWDRYKGAMFCGIPIESQFEYDIVQLIKQYIDIEAPAKYVSDVYRSCMRELAMAGSFEKAKEAYEQFYSLDFKRYGVDIAPKLTEIRSTNPLLQSSSKLLLPEENTGLQLEQLRNDKLSKEDKHEA